MALTTSARSASPALQSYLQTSLFAADEFRCGTVCQAFEPLDDRSSVLFSPGWIRGSDNVFEELRTDMPWQAMKRPMYDRIVEVPRLICAQPVAKLKSAHPLAVITRELESALNLRFESVGLNYYRDGNDSVAWHRDGSRSTARPGTVALVALGAPRTLAMRPHAEHPAKTAETTRITGATRHRWLLGHGDLLVMSGACQHDWEHRVPKEPGAGPRISLAFRSADPVRGSTSGRRRSATISG